MNRRGFLYGGATILGAGGAVGLLLASRPAGGAPVTKDEIGDKVQTLPRGQLPAFAGTPDLQTLYRYAVEHGDELRYIPCMCGCGSFGHTSNRDCYIKADNADGTLTFTSHAATWSLCLNITRDVMAIRKRGRSLLEARRAVDARYRGKPTPTPFPKE